MNKVCNYAARSAVSAAAVGLMGVSVGMFRLARFGVDPYSAMNLGISSALGLSFGTWQLIMNFALLVLVAVFRRRMIGFGTLANMALVGYVSDFAVKLAGAYPQSLAARALLLAGAVVFICFACAMYLACGVGASPYDAMGYIASDALHGRLKFRVTRIILDVICVAVGFACAAAVGEQWSTVGIGTVIMAGFTGPLVQFFRDRICDPLIAALFGAKPNRAPKAADA